MSVYQHFRKFEHPFVDAVLSWVDNVERTYTPYVTDFLDPREQAIIASLIGTQHDEVKYAFFGGYEGSERKRGCIAPIYETVTEEMFGVTLLEASYPSKFVSIRHRDILGSLMSLGIERKTLGDISVRDGIFQFFINREMASYVQMNLTQVKQSTVKLQSKSYEERIESAENWLERQHTVSSLRLDVLIKEIYKIPRSLAATLIKQQKVKVNFTKVDDPSTLLLEGDLISVKGYGRSKFLYLGGTTRKDKRKITSARLEEK